MIGWALLATWGGLAVVLLGAGSEADVAMRHIRDMDLDELRYSLAESPAAGALFVLLVLPAIYMALTLRDSFRH